MHRGWVSFVSAGNAGVEKDIPPIALLRRPNGDSSALECLHCIHVTLLCPASERFPEQNYPESYWLAADDLGRQVVVNLSWKYGPPEETMGMYHQWYRVEPYKID